MCSNVHNIAPELLAPARDYACGKAAVDSGADAVYIAGPAFGAREAAGNPVKEVARLARYGQRYGVKTYLTLNTLLYPHEYETARRLAQEAWEAGCSALIIQDPALLELDLPPIPLFASTQMDNRSLEQVQRLERLGFARVILARELSLAQIVQIRKHTTIDLECFIHGSLCVSYSGRCYLSEYLTGRSANRGTCAQPCRNKYNLEDATGRIFVRNQHLLSLRDLRIDDYLEALTTAGVSSFKIEGRLKDSGYVKNVVGWYRRQIDRLGGGANASLGSSALTFAPNPERSFSRGHTLYNITGVRDEWTTKDYGKARGHHIGTIIPSGVHFLLDLQPDVCLKAGDGICYLNHKGQLTGSLINAIYPAPDPNRWLAVLQSPAPVGRDNRLYLNYDHVFEKDLAKPQSAKRLIEVELRVKIGIQSAVFQASIPFGPKVSLTIPCTGSPAQQPEQANLQIRNQLEKTAENLYLFRLESLANHCAQFFPTSQINQWRRSLGQALLEASTDFFKPQPRKQIPPDPKALRELKQHIPSAGTIPPVLMWCKHCIKYDLGYCGKEGLNEPLWLVNQEKRFRLSFDCLQCEMKISKK